MGAMEGRGRPTTSKEIVESYHGESASLIYPNCVFVINEKPMEMINILSSLFQVFSPHV